MYVTVFHALLADRKKGARVKMYLFVRATDRWQRSKGLMLRDSLEDNVLPETVQRHWDEITQFGSGSVDVRTRRMTTAVTLEITVIFAV